METLERNRVFDQSSLQTLLSRGVELFNNAIEKSTRFETQAMKVFQLANQVPGEARDAGLISYCQSLIASTAFRTEEYTEMMQMLNTYINRLLTEVYSYDLLAAQAINDIVTCVAELGSVADELKELLAAGVLNRDINDYMQVLECCKSKWDGNKVDFDSKMAMATGALKGMQALCTYSEDPVNLSTGNFVYQKTDLTIRGKQPLCFSRFYNAMDMEKGILGRGWRHSFEEKLVLRDREILYIGSDGREESFEQDGKYTFRSKVTGKKSLHTTRSGFHYKDEQENTYFWSKEGKLINKVPVRGCRICYEYDNDGKLKKVSTDAGDSFYFCYEGGRLVRVSDHTERSVSFEYEKDRIIRVTDPCGGRTEYSYGRNNRIDAITNEENVVTVCNEYDRSNRITGQTFADGGEASYEYKDAKNQIIYTEPNGDRKSVV